MTVCEDFYGRINAFVTKKLDRYTPAPTSGKVIHDTIWGSVLYNGWEIQIIDSPLFQRLRDIRQLGRAETTYPSAHHTRFEHSLGTTAIASRMIDKLAERSAGLEITQRDRNKVRLAALLHDVGHCFYSHLSENVYGNTEPFLQVRADIEKDLDEGIHPKPHELFSYMIIRSEAFLTFFAEHVDYPEKGDRESCRALLKECANMVVGQMNRTCDENGNTVVYSFMTQILNGDLDADKLDYTQRDSYTSGIALTYGIERFLMKIVLCKIQKDSETRYELAISSDAVTTVEELIFNRNMLYVYMYRHQKVLAAEAAVRDVIHGMVACGILSHPCDFLKFTDDRIATLDTCDLVPYPDIAPNRTLGDMIRLINRRALPKRAFELRGSDIEVICADELRREFTDKTLKAIESGISENEKIAALKNFADEYTENYSDDELVFAALKKLSKRLGFADYDGYMTLREKLFERLRDEYEKDGEKALFDVFDIHIVFPPLSSGKTEFLVLRRGSLTPEINRFEYIGTWSRAFNASNYRGYVFVSSAVDRAFAGAVCTEFFGEYGDGVHIKEKTDEHQTEERL